MGAEQSLRCPRCGRALPSSERFCEECGMPLVREGAGEWRPTERERRLRKIKPEYARGELVSVAVARDLSQAEFLAGLLLEEGIPSVLRASIAGYAPVIGTREVLVPQSAQDAAREALSFGQPRSEED